MRLGIVGLPNIGKTTLFNALTRAGAPAENYPFCTIDPNVGVVTVPDERLYELNKIYNSKQITPAIIEFVDIAGLVKGASKGEGLGNKFLSHIREVDAVVHIVRCFASPEVIHVDGSVDPVRDIETINTELILADLESVQKRIERSEKAIKSQSDKKALEYLEMLKKLMDHLSSGKTAKTFLNNEDDKAAVYDLHLLTDKPVLYAANVSEDVITKDPWADPGVIKIKEFAEIDHSGTTVICIKLEEELSHLADDEKKEFLTALGLKHSGLEDMISSSYKLLGLFSFITAGEKEIRAWTIPYGTKAPQAAGKIHTDFEKGFIRAEIVNYEDLMKLGSLSAAREQGKVRTEGKDYVMRENDVVLFRFNI